MWDKSQDPDTDWTKIEDTDCLTEPPPDPDPEPDLTFDDVSGKILWYDAGSGPQVDDDFPGLVHTWTDLSTNGKNAIQYNPVNRPTLVDNVINGLPVVRFDATGRYMDINSFETGGDVTVFVVAINRRTFETTPNAVDVILSTTDSGNLPGGGGININTFNWYADQQQRQIICDSGGPGSTVSIFKNGSSADVKLDYAEPAVITYKGANVKTNDNMTLALFTNYNNNGKNDVAEIIIYNRLLTDEEQDIVEEYLMEKYDIASYTVIDGDDTVPNYQFITHQLAPLPIWGSQTRPYPTNVWWSPAFIDQYGNGTSNMIKQFPYSVKCKATTLEMCLPTQTVTTLKISENYSANMSFGATETIASEVITHFDELSFSEKWSVDVSHYMTSDIVKGCPYITMKYTALTPKIVTASTISSVNGSATTPVTDTKFKIVLANGQTWLLYASSSITLAWASGTMTASGTFTGSLRLANMQDAGDETILDTYKTRIPSAGTVGMSVTGDTGTYTYDFVASGSGSLLMVALPHHVDILVSPSTEALNYPTLKGTTTGIVGDTWTLEEPLSTITWDSPRAPDSGKVAAITAALANDYTFVPSPEGTYLDGDVYFYGKEFSKMARMALIADELGETAKRNTLLTNLKTGINRWLNSENNNRLRYDTVWGGIITQKGATQRFGDFTAGWYSDHNIHWGYFAYAAAVIGKFDATWLATYKNKVNDLVRDYANFDKSDEYYPYVRAKDFYDGHTWLSGLFEFDAGKNQESSSESVMSYYGLYLWGITTGDNSVRDKARILLAMEIRSAIKYWHIKTGDAIYNATYAANKVVGILWSGQIDYTVFFEQSPQGTHREWLFGIQMLPFMPNTEDYLDSAWVTDCYSYLDDALTRKATAHAIVSGGAVTAIKVDDGYDFTTTKGYTNNPIVTITGDGTGATATGKALQPQGGALQITLTNGGSGYTNSACGNLIDNPSAETNTVWQKGGNTSNVTIASSDEASDGTKSIKIVQAGGGSFAYQDIPVSAGQVIKFAAEAKITSHTSGGVGIYLKPTDYSITYASSTTLDAVGGFTRLSGTWTVPSGVTIVRFILDGHAGQTNALTCYWDKMFFEVANSLNTYCTWSADPADPVVDIAPAIEPGWIGFIYMFHAIIDKATAWTEINTLTKFDNGNSKTNALYWVATRP